MRPIVYKAGLKTTHAHIWDMSFQPPPENETCLTSKVPEAGYDVEQLQALFQSVCDLDLEPSNRFVSADTFTERFRKLAEYVQRLDANEFFQACEHDQAKLITGTKHPGANNNSSNANVYKTTLRVCPKYDAKTILKVYDSSKTSLTRERKRKIERFFINCVIHSQQFPFFANPIRVGKFKLPNKRTLKEGFAVENVAVDPESGFDVVVFGEEEPPYKITDNSVKEVIKSAPNRLMIDGIVIQLVSSLEYMRNKRIFHHDLHWKNVFLTPLKNLYGMSQSSYLVFDSLNKCFSNEDFSDDGENEDERLFKMNGIIKIIDWDNTVLGTDSYQRDQGYSESQRLIYNDSLALLRHLRSTRREYWEKFMQYLEGLGDTTKEGLRNLNQYLSSTAFGEPIHNISKEEVDLENPLKVLEDLREGEYEIRRFEYYNPDDKKNLSWDQYSNEYKPTDHPGTPRFTAEKIGENMYFVDAGSDVTPHHIFEFKEKELLKHRVVPEPVDPRDPQDRQPDILSYILKEDHRKHGEKVDFKITVEKRKVSEQYTDENTFYGQNATETKTTLILNEDLLKAMNRLYDFAIENIKRTSVNERCFPFVRSCKSGIGCKRNRNNFLGRTDISNEVLNDEEFERMSPDKILQYESRLRNLLHNMSPDSSPDSSPRNAGGAGSSRGRGKLPLREESAEPREDSAEPMDPLSDQKERLEDIIKAGLGTDEDYEEHYEELVTYLLGFKDIKKDLGERDFGEYINEVNNEETMDKILHRTLNFVKYHKRKQDPDALSLLRNLADVMGTRGLNDQVFDLFGRGNPKDLFNRISDMFGKYPFVLKEYQFENKIKEQLQTNLPDHANNIVKYLYEDDQEEVNKLGTDIKRRVLYLVSDWIKEEIKSDFFKKYVYSPNT